MRAPGQMGWMDAKTDDLLARTDGKIEKDPMALLIPILWLLGLALALVIGMLLMSLARNDDQLSSEHVCSPRPPDTTTHKDRREIYTPEKISPQMHTPESAWASSETLLHTIPRISSSPPVCCKSPETSGENGDLHMCSTAGVHGGWCARGARGVESWQGCVLGIPRGGGETGRELHTGAVG